MKRITGILLLLALAVGTGCASQEKTVELVFKYKTGEVLQYKTLSVMEMSAMDIPGPGSKPYSAKVVTLTTQKVLGVLPDGSAKMRVRIKRTTIDASGIPRPDAKKAPETVMTVKVSKYGQVLSSDVQPSNTSLSGMDDMDILKWQDELGYIGSLPRWPVKVGDQWQQTVPLPMSSGTMKVVSTLVTAAMPIGKHSASRIDQAYEGSLDAKNILLASLDQLGKFGMPEDLRSVMKNMNCTINVMGSSNAYFSSAQGKVIKAVSEGQGVVKVTFPAELTSRGMPPEVTRTMRMRYQTTRIK